MTEKYDDAEDKANDELKNIVAQPHPGEDLPQDEDTWEDEGGATDE